MIGNSSVRRYPYDYDEMQEPDAVPIDHQSSSSQDP